MVDRKPEGRLTNEEKTIVKALLQKGRRNQDIQALLNIGRAATINSARITEVKQNQNIKTASDEEVEFFEIKKGSFDFKTGLNLIEDERLIRAREAMVLAVQIYNSAALSFKTEVFVVLTNIAWTYLLHEFYERKGAKIIDKDGRSLLLGQMIERHDCPLSKGVCNNLLSLKTIRDDVEHKLLGKSDIKWQGLFQTSCLNFENAICKLFGQKLSLAKELSFALQFSRLNFEQLATLNKFEIPAHIDALDARLNASLNEEERTDLEYQFRVVYTLDAGSKGKSHFEFLRPESVEGKAVQNVLVNYKISDEMYPHKAGQVCKLVSKRIGKAFKPHNHVQAWRLFKVRPASKSKQPENTEKDYCIYHPAHGDYTYSEKWVVRLVEECSDEERFSALKAFK
jgi:Protein of unknown function (DUF3644)